MGKTSRLALMLVLFFVIGAAVLLDKDPDKKEADEDGAVAGTESGLAGADESSWFGAAATTTTTPEMALTAIGRGHEPGTFDPEVRATSGRAAVPAPEPRREAAPLPRSAPSGGGKTYTVQAGDTPGGISTRFFGSSRHWKTILEANGLSSPRDLQIGRELKIPEIAGGGSPSGGAVADRGATRPESSRSAGGGGERLVVGSKIYHVVQKGERLWDIARRYYGSGVYWRTIRDLNRDLIDDPNRLSLGMKILIGDKSRMPAE